MSDRTPLAEVEDKVEPRPEVTQSREELASDQSISEMQDLHELSVMMGFEHGFDGSNPEALYQWAKSYTGEPGGPKVLSHIKDTMRLIGSTEKGPQLLKKLNMYATLDSKQNAIQMRKENLI